MPNSHEVANVSFALLSKYGISSPASAVVSSPAMAASAAAKIGFPVAMKIISPSALHKSDKGGVVLGVQGRAEAEKAFSALVQRFSGSKIDGVLVQRMAGRDAVELIVGGKRDLQFGQLIMLGLGGVFVEVFRDVSFRVCPITKEDASDMIRELRAYPILAGARGRKPINLSALALTLVKVSNLLQKEDPAEFDINPLMADERGCTAVDMRMLK